MVLYLVRIVIGRTRGADTLDCVNPLSIKRIEQIQTIDRPRRFHPIAICSGASPPLYPSILAESFLNGHCAGEIASATSNAPAGEDSAGASGVTA
jgi:hypothetical protein